MAMLVLTQSAAIAYGSLQSADEPVPVVQTEEGNLQTIGAVDQSAYGTVLALLAATVLVLAVQVWLKTRVISRQREQYLKLHQECDEMKELYMAYRARVRSGDRLQAAANGAARHSGVDGAAPEGHERKDKLKIPGEVFLEQMTTGLSREIEDPLNRISTGVETLRVTLAELVEELRKRGEAETPALVGSPEVNDLINDSNELMEKISASAAQTKNTLRKLGVFNSLRDDEAQLLNLNSCVDEVVGMLSDKLTSNIEVKKYYDTTMPEITAAVGSLNHLFINLLLNAIQAIEPKKSGIISIYTENRGDEVIVKIHDTGAGIPDSVKPRIFEPFFTTRTTGEASGLGLSICYGIVKENNGEIVVSSKEGEGTEIEVIFPVTVKAQKIC